MEILETVHNCFFECMFKDNEIVDRKPPADAVIVDGIIHKFGFHPGRLAENKEKIREVLNQMPVEFFKEGGGGWSFLNLCMTRDNIQWGEHRDMEQLVVLAIAMGMAKYLMPKEVWQALPGGMPYIVFDTSK